VRATRETRPTPAGIASNQEALGRQLVWSALIAGRETCLGQVFDDVTTLQRIAKAVLAPRRQAVQIMLKAGPQEKDRVGVQRLVRCPASRSTLASPAARKLWLRA